MPVISNTLLFYPTEAHMGIVYEVQPQHLPRDGVPESAIWGRWYGTQIAHMKDGAWFKPGGWEEITDLKTITLLERVPLAWLPASTAREL